ncbi:hypothetical protein [Olleya sp. ITB9]|uniref:hypothetical protein n=1 Tax=Olleya sp. ITB9 TaxID=1715648 RepID=UPI0006D0FB04|nr:hypothetical protein [Olleya sp. ITB9]
MKTLQLSIIALLTFTINSQAQNNQTKTKDSTTINSNNFLDKGTETLTSIFGENLDGNSTGKTLGYIELLEKSDLPEKQKIELKNQYYLLAKDLTQKQKDSLGQAIGKQIKEAKKDE